MERGAGRKRKMSDNYSGNSNPDNRNSLRVGTTSKKGRGASLNQRRGSLKKRDRSAEKEARAEAARERKTVSLPE